jgi:2-desacetyl-2-hydroxyethyl bacteriochlorophyllide A dehydrogenase
MKSLTYLGGTSVGITQKDVPAPARYEVRIKVAYAGICGTDLHIQAGKHPRASAGLTMGHEFSGVVDAIGEESAMKIGTRVVVEPLISCGKCYSCRAGFPHVCSSLGLYGIDKDGGFAEYVVIPEDRIFAVPDSIPLTAAALIEPLAVGVHAVRRSSVKSIDTVLVIGGGPIGLFTAIASKAAGVSVYIAEINPQRRLLLQTLEFELFETENDDIGRYVANLTDGKGFDVVFDAAGSRNTLKMAAEFVRVRGEVVLVAIPPEDRLISYVPFSFKEISLKGIRVYEYYDFKRAITLMKSLTYDFSMIYQLFSIESFKKAFDSARSGNDGMRVLFEIDGELE